MHDKLNKQAGLISIFLSPAEEHPGQLRTAVKPPSRTLHRSNSPVGERNTSSSTSAHHVSNSRKRNEMHLPPV